jgi:tRNA A37 threonylcarbamoyladenosine biosynthesis protein TsaE
MDLYRLDEGRPDVFLSLDLENIFRNSVSLIEWPVRLPDKFVPQDRLDVKLTIRQESSEDSEDDTDKAERILMFTPHGSFWEGLLQEIVYRGYLDDFMI